MQKNENLRIQPELTIRRLGGLASLNEHEPPIGVGGGRFFVDIPQNMNLNGPIQFAPYVYVFQRDSESKSETHYTGISALLSVTENDSGYVDVVTYSTSAVEGNKLHIWFGENTEPDCVLEVVDSEIQLTISDTLEPPIPNPTKSHRPYRRICSNPQSQIKKWELVGSNGVTLRDPINGTMVEDFGDDYYHLYISFAHHEHEE